LFSSPSIIKDDQIKEDEIRRACSKHGGKEECILDLLGKPERKRPLGRPPHMWGDNIKMDLKEIEWSGMDWTDMDQDRDK
jgi:hypothetical protein